MKVFVIAVLLLAYTQGNEGVKVTFFPDARTPASCSAKPSDISCCFQLPFFDNWCINIKNGTLGTSVQVTHFGLPAWENTIPADSRPVTFCLPLTVSPVPKVEICLNLMDSKWENSTFYTCSNLSFKLAENIVTTANLDCVRFGLKGIEFIKPQERLS
ncbi:uncharacterized protein LOC124169049 [Ischnura elegans]|uniref:uncharacterized protein LOC124169049 n=1 Tax=Ischnura elegans TaxID=197161 RepID=UPI001ED8B3FD|nr:uncharacterized protein LOC124169049 [Ischnura elegans]